MFDHAFLAAVDVLRGSFEQAMLDGRQGEERLQSELLGGDLTWEGSFALPGEARPPKIRADVTVDWPTWSQTALRTLMLEGELDEPPELGIEIVLRIQQLAAPPDLGAIRGVLDDEGPEFGRERLHASSPMVEQLFDEELEHADWAVEFAFDGSFEFTEATISDRSELERAFTGVGPWVASQLVRLGDLRLAYRPPDDADDRG